MKEFFLTLVLVFPLREIACREQGKHKDKYIKHEHTHLKNQKQSSPQNNKKIEILFVTGNDYKFNTVKQWIYNLDPSIELVKAECDLPEIQSLDMESVAKEKAQDAWNTLNAPLIVDDGGAYFDNYPLFPGTFTKHMLEALGHKGLWKLIKDNPRGWLQQSMVYVDREGTQVFIGKCDGIFIEDARGASSPLNNMFIPDGDTRTFGEMNNDDPARKLHCRYKSVEQLVAWLKENR